MNFTESISSGFRRYFDFRTRSSRSEYWWWTLFTILVSIAATILDTIIFGGSAFFDTLSSLVLLIPGLALAVRRLHDVDRSGWWILIAFTIIGIIFPLLYWSLKRGTQGTNRHGPDPLMSPADTSSEGFGYDQGSPSEHRFCSSCGSAQEADANFCRTCGTAV
ncbi:MAG: DUF805 domain-containing protein [Chloroflexi bacterium]|nr:DUF805 domain-containing protein [Chloroflexota bacterium]